MRADEPEQAERADDPRDIRVANDDLTQRLAQLPDGHPSSDGYRDGDRSSLSEAEWTEHIASVSDRVVEANRAGQASDHLHTTDPDRTRWTRERRQSQNEIIDVMYKKATDVPNDGKAIIAGGLAGAGKTTVLEFHAEIDRSQYLTISADDIKEELAARRLIPEVNGLSPMEASELVHKESSYIANRLAARARGDEKNLLWDITMSSRESVEARIDDLRTAGYTKVSAVFVDLPIEVSLRRAESRYKEGQEAYWAGEGLGGRYLPPGAISTQADPEWGSKNRRAFEEVKPHFDEWVRFDNGVDGRDPVQLEHSSHRDDPERSIA